MLPDPLHPALVHLPIALALLVPLVALLTWFLVYRGYFPVRVWVLVVFLQALLLGSGWAALASGEAQEDRVESIVGEAPLDAHEDAARRLLFAAGVTLLVSCSGLLRGRAGGTGRLGTLAFAVLTLATAVQVGSSGGALVFQHGAATAYGRAPVSAGESGADPHLRTLPAADQGD